MNFLALALVSLLFLSAAPSASEAQSPQEQTHVATVEFLYVGLGDATLIRAPQGKVALIDAGPSDNIVALLRERGITVIDVAIVTHRHVDHFGGMDAVLKAFEVKQLIENGSPNRSAAYARFLSMVEARNIPTTSASRIDKPIELGSVVLKLLPLPPQLFPAPGQPPDPDDVRLDASENDRSIGVRVQYGDVSFLITGDSARVERAWWLANADPSLYRNTTILRLAHHGAATGTDAAWLDATTPQVAVASMGLDVVWRRWNMPAHEVVQLLQSRRIKLHNTGLSGTIGVRTNGRAWEIFKDGATVQRRVSTAARLFQGLQYLLAAIYLVVLSWVFRHYRGTSVGTASHGFVAIGIAPILLVLYGFIGSSFGLPDLFWHERRAMQFVAGLSVMLLALLLAVFASKIGVREPSTLAADPMASGARVTNQSLGRRFDHTHVGIAVLLLVLPPAFLRVFSQSSDPSIAHALNRVWLPAGMLTGLAVVTSVVGLIRPKDSVAARWPIVMRTLLGAATLGVIVTIVLVLTGTARPPAAVSICLVIALLSVAAYWTLIMRRRRYALLLAVSMWIVLTHGSDPYRLRLPGLEEYYASEKLVDVSYFRGSKDGLTGWGIESGQRDGEMRLLHETELLGRWKNTTDSDVRRPLVVVSVSGGGIAAAVWTALCLERLIEAIPGFAGHVRVITGASGGMVGAGYFAASLTPPPAPVGKMPASEFESKDDAVDAAADRRDPATAAPRLPPSVNLVDDLTKDFLTPVASHIALAGLPSLLWPGRIENDRGRVLESAWEESTHGILGTPFMSLAAGEDAGWRPSLIVSPMMVEEGRPLLVSNLDLAYLDELELFKMFPRANRLKLSTVLRMNAAFPLVTPAISLPTVPPRRVVDAGYFDNYGVSTAAAWISANQDWLMNNTGGVVLIQIRAYPLESVETQGRFLASVARSLQGITSPLEGYTAAKKTAMIDRNNSRVAQLQESFQQRQKNPNFFVTVVLECEEEAALSWTISRPDTGRLSDALGSVENMQALERVQILLGAKRGSIGRITP